MVSDVRGFRTLLTFSLNVDSQVRHHMRFRRIEFRSGRECGLSLSWAFRELPVWQRVVVHPACDSWVERCGMFILEKYDLQDPGTRQKKKTPLIGTFAFWCCVLV